ncbi:FERM and PDZ domain-containing protein 1 [Indicator indicator]|uniref:FERM and PDZ domain-containing protein 1 n=1 Tax=Indicator indicator TaxID=1002788 RepID=UPI0023DF2D2A|nr:FERM and PDZ domain-containing protein 1 [Indicator indicator]
MEDLEANLIQTRKACRIEQMVAKWLHRSRDGASRGRVSMTDSTSDGSSQPASRVKLTVTVYKDLVLGHYGFEICPSLPLTVASVVAGSTAEGKLQPGDQLLLINSTAVDDVPIERAADIIREAGDKLLLTILRCTLGGPKSSFLTAEKRARLKTNPVKVRFAEEVLVNGHTQGNSLLCMPNVLKVYLENGQTKAFRFETSTTVKDIILTLKEKLSLCSIAHFALTLEEQYNVAKIHLLHEEELIEQVVQKREAHDCRCLFRVCFVPKDPLDLLQEDPVAFDYLYLQSCSDVLQERFAVEMKCSVALRLAALHMQERICACAQPQKVSLKYIERDWGIENFISPTLLRNMRGKDIKKAISYHMKQNQVLLDPRQKHMLMTVQVRLSYLQILGDLKMYNGRIFNATLMLQDRESYVALLVGAKYGVSQIVNNKLNIVRSLAEFTNISRLELTEESEKVSMVKIYLQDLKVLTLLLESSSAKDLVCLITGYYRLFVDANISIFTWAEKRQQLHRVSAEEGYESRTGSDSEDSWELDSPSEHGLDIATTYCSTHPVCHEEDLGQLHSLQVGRSDQCDGGDNTTDSTSEASDSANTESRGFKTSGSSDSMDALEEDELEAYFSSRPEIFHFYTPTVQQVSSSDKTFSPVHAAGSSSKAESRDYFCFLQVSHAEESGCEDSPSEQRGEDTGVSVLETELSERNTIGYYSLCYSTSPAGSTERSSTKPATDASDLILEPPPGFGDTSSEEEFYDAADRLSPQDARAGFNVMSWQGRDNCSCIPKKPQCYSSEENVMTKQTAREKELACAKSLRKRRSFLQTDYTSQVTFPLALPGSLQSCCSWPPTAPLLAQTPASPSSETTKDADLGCPAATWAQRDSASTNASPEPVEMEPDTMETKPVTDLVISSLSAVQLQGDQRREQSAGVTTQVGSGLQPAHVTPFLSQEETVSLPEGQSRAAQESSSVKPNGVSEESCKATGGWMAQVALEEMGEVMTVQHKAGGAPPFLGQEVTYLANGHTLPPSAQGPSVASPHEEAQDKKNAGRQAVSKGLVPAPCEKRKAHGNSCPGQSSDSALPKSRQVVKKEALWKVHSKNHVGFPEASQLLADCSSTSGVLTRLSWLSFGVRTDLTSPSPYQERVDNTQELSASRKTSGCLGADAVRREMPASPAGPLSEKVVVSSEVLDGESRKDAESAAHKQLWPVQNPLHNEQTTEVEKDSLLTPSAGFSSGTIPLGSLGKRAGDHGASKRSFLCFNHKKNEQTPPDAIMISTERKTSPQLGTDKCSCHLSYISCFHRPDDKGEREITVPMCSTFLGPLTTPPPSSCSLPAAPVSCYPISIARGVAGQDPHMQALSQLKDQAWMSPADFSCILAYTIELQEVVAQLSGNQRTHLQDQCAEQGAESKGALGLASRDLLSSCQELLKIEQPLKELQEVLRVTFDYLLQLAVACFQVTHCQQCRQRQPELGAALVDVVGTYHQLVQAVYQQLHRQSCPDLGAKLLACQHTALTAAMFCLLQQFSAQPSL